MQTIGDRLEEARKHKGISIREAAEATKIRGEYLAAFEGNSFDIDLPEIYIRGFLRNYANFLKLNGTRILTDYDALGTGENAYPGPAAKEEGRAESYGRMDLGESQAGATEMPRPTPQGEDAHERRRDSAFVGDEGSDRTFYYKVGGIVAGSLVAVVLLGYVVVSVIGSDAQENDNSAAEEAAEGTEGFFLVGTGEIDSVEVTEVETGETLFSGSISDGDRIPLRRRGPVNIVVSQRQNLRLEEEGGRGGGFPGSGRGETRWEGFRE